MRVITGIAKGMKLETLDGDETRPTSDRVKESIFNIIQFDIEGRRALDLFAGSGQLGIEALSRGARSAVFVDNSGAAARVIRNNLEKTRLLGNSRVIQSNYDSYLRTCHEQFELIFLDPPYQSKMLQKSLEIISEFDILAIRGIIICEHPDTGKLSFTDMGKYDVKDYQYGKTIISVLTRQIT